MRVWRTQLKTTVAERELSVWSGEVLERVMEERLMKKQGPLEPIGMFIEGRVLLQQLWGRGEGASQGLLDP